MSARFEIPNCWNIERKADRLLNLFSSQYVYKLHQLYRKHFKKIKLVREANSSLWRVNQLVRLALNLISLGELSKPYPVIKFKEYVRKNRLSVTSLISSCDVNTFLPRVYPLKDASLVTPKLLSYEFSSIDVVALQNTKVFGGSNIVFVDEMAICHDLYDFKTDSTSEELHNIFRIDVKRNTIKIKKQPKYIIEILPTAAVFLDACAHNYAHWITEVLPRIAAFCKEDRFKDVPLIIDQGLHINLIESLGPIVGYDRKILTLPMHQCLQIESLLLVSVAGYVPFGVRSRKFSGPSHGEFSPLALKEVREKILGKIQGQPKKDWPDKIYLSRITQTRKLLNGLNLECALFNRGYKQVDPGDLTFLEQAQLFSGAREIVATTGAALVNAIFAPPGSKITVIMSKHEDMIYRYWLNMLSPFGLDITYILGDISSKKYLGIHADFSIANQSVRDYFVDMDKA
jgi:capsular polysaccharide biosynthesis protein